jgi:hypothetical protein
MYLILDWAEFEITDTLGIGKSGICLVCDRSIPARQWVMLLLEEELMLKEPQSQRIPRRSACLGIGIGLETILRESIKVKVTTSRVLVKVEMNNDVREQCGSTVRGH